MKKLIEGLKKGIYVLPVLCFALGLFVFISPDTSTRLLCQMIGGILILYGLFNAVTQFWHDERQLSNNIQCVIGGIIAIIGFWVVFAPQNAMPIIPILLGLFIVLHSVQDITYSYKLKNIENSNWQILLLLSIIITVLGILALVQPDFIKTMVLPFIGISLMLDGVLSIYLVIRLSFSKPKNVSADAHCVVEDTPEIVYNEVPETTANSDIITPEVEVVDITDQSENKQ